jgi:hypothetical protein
MASIRFKLAFEVNLAKGFQLLEVERLAELLLADQLRIRRLLLPALDPW